MSQVSFPFSKEEFEHNICKYLEVEDINAPCDFELLLHELNTCIKIARFGTKFFQHSLLAYDCQMSFVGVPGGTAIDGQIADESFYIYREKGIQGRKKISFRAIRLETGAKVVLQETKNGMNPQEMLRSEWLCIKKIKAIDGASCLAIPEKTALAGEVLIVPFAGENLCDYVRANKSLPLSDLATIFRDLSAALAFLENPSNFANHASYVHRGIVAKHICVDVRKSRVVKATLIDLKSLIPAGHLSQDRIHQVRSYRFSSATECMEAYRYGSKVTSAANLYSMGVLLLRILSPHLGASLASFEDTLSIADLVSWRSRGRALFIEALRQALDGYDMGSWGDLMTVLLHNDPAARTTAKAIEGAFAAMLQTNSTRVWEYPLENFSIDSFCSIPSVLSENILPTVDRSYLSRDRWVCLRFFRNEACGADFQNSARALEWIQEARELDASGANKRVTSLLEVLYNDHGTPALILLDGGTSLEEYQAISPEKCGAKEIAELIAQMYEAFVFLSHVGRCRTLDLIHTEINPKHLLLQTFQKQSISFQLCGFSSSALAGDTLDHYPIDFYAAPWAMEEYRQKKLVKADRAIDLFGLLHVVWFALEPQSVERFARECFLRNEDTRSDHLAEVKAARDCWLQGNSVSSFPSEMIDLFIKMGDGSAVVADLDLDRIGLQNSRKGWRHFFSNLRLGRKGHTAFCVK